MALEYSEWTKLDSPQKLDALREEVMATKRLIQYGVAAAGVFGAAFGSTITILVEHAVGAH